VIGTTTTAGDGSYSFANLVAGTYTVVAPSTAGGYNLETAASLSVPVMSGQNNGGNNFGYVAPPPGSLSGTLYIDANKNSLLDSGEAKLGNVTVTLKDGNGNVIGTTPTAPDGTYSFTGLPAGIYTVVVPSTAGGYSLETASPLPVEVTSGENNGGNDFGYIGTGGLSGTLYVDANKNSSLDSGEAKLGGITVTLKDSNGNVVTTAITDNNGLYSFTGLMAGTYTVVAPSTANGYSLETTNPLTAIVVVGQSTPNKNFGYISNVAAVGSLSGVAYVDLNGDKTYNAGEPLLSGVVITLIKPGGATATTTTNTSGFYQFTGLPAGSYTVSAPATTAGKTLVTSSPLTVPVVSNQNTPNNNFGYIVAHTTGNFTTYTQGGWGAKPSGNNPGALLANNFANVFGSAGVTIGGTYTYNFSSALAVRNFLPQGGTPTVLTASATNPTTKINVLAGQVLALQLSVSFSNAGITRNGLSSLTVVSGPLAGKTVAQVLALADAVLGGNTAALPSGLTVSGLNDIVTAINQNYDNGTIDNHYLH